MTEPVRLAKRLAELLSCSRRVAELYIEGGWVMVDGVVVEESHHRVQDEAITLHPEASPTPLEPITMLLHLPAEAGDVVPEAYLTATNRAAEDRTGIRQLKRHLVKLAVNAPLEAGASGMLILTQDWRVSRRLTEDATDIEHEYIVEVRGTLAADGLQKLSRGPLLPGLPHPVVKVSWQSETKLRFAIKGPQPGQIRQLCEAVGLTVIALKRIRIGRVSMAGLAAGQWRYLPATTRF